MIISKKLGVSGLATGLLANAAAAQEAVGLDEKINQAFPDFTNGKWVTRKPVFGISEEY